PAVRNPTSGRPPSSSSGASVRLLELFLPPEGRQRRRIGGDRAAGFDHGVDVEEGPVRVEDVAAERGHRGAGGGRGEGFVGRGWGRGSGGLSSPASTKPYFRSFLASRNEAVRVREPRPVMKNCCPPRHADTARL